jgi:hypothetical protein
VRKRTKGDDLAIVASCMDQWTRDENRAYVETVRAQSQLIDLEHFENTLLRDEILRLQTRMRVMERSMRGMIAVITENERVLQSIQPDRAFVTEIGMDHHGVPHALTVVREEDEFPVGQEELDMVADEEYDSDATIPE